MKNYLTPRKNRVTIFLDIDSLLVDVQALHQLGNITKDSITYQTRKKGIGKWPLQPFRFPLYSLCVMSKKSYNLIHFRPYVKEFLSFCFDHFNVAFISELNHLRVSEIIVHLLHITNKYDKDIVFAWAYSKKKTHWIDVFTNEVVKQFSEKSISKRALSLALEGSFDVGTFMNVIYTTFSTLNNKNTLLIRSSHKSDNKIPTTNTIYIPIFSYLNVYDIYLKTFYEKQNAFIENNKKQTSTQKSLISIEDLQSISDKTTIEHTQQSRDTVFTRHLSSLEIGQNVIIPYKDLYHYAQIYKLDEKKRKAYVNVSILSKTTSKKKTLKRMTAKTIVSYDDIIEDRYWEAFDP